MSPDPITQSVQVHADGGVVTARIGAASVEEREAIALLGTVRIALEQAGPGLRVLVLDVEGVTFINSAGLAALVELRQGAGARGARTVLYRTGPEVDSLLRMVRLDSLFAMVRSEPQLRRLVAP